ncbi:MAG: hypothetical protein ACRCW9_02995 [Cetobacterium sp.]
MNKKVIPETTYDFETMELYPAHGKTTQRPVSMAYQRADGTKRQYYINPRAYGGSIQDIYDPDYNGGWRKEYQKAYEVHKIQTGHLTGQLALPENTQLVVNQQELADMYDDLLGVYENPKVKSGPRTKKGAKIRGIKKAQDYSDDVLLGFNNHSFDDPIMQDQVMKFGSARAKHKLRSIKTKDARELAMDVLGAEGDTPQSFKAYFNSIGLPDTKNGTLAGFLGIASDSSKLHDAAYDVEVTQELNNRLKAIKTVKTTMMNTKDTNVWKELYAGLGAEYGEDIYKAAGIQDVHIMAQKRGMDLNDLDQFIKKAKEKSESAKVEGLKKQGYNGIGSAMQKLKAGVSVASKAVEQAGISQKNQKKAGIAAGAIGLGLFAKSFFTNPDEQQNKKLETINEKINGQKGRYIEY